MVLDFIVNLSGTSANKVLRFSELSVNNLNSRGIVFLYILSFDKGSTDFEGLHNSVLFCALNPINIKSIGMITLHFK